MSPNMTVTHAGIHSDSNPDSFINPAPGVVADLPAPPIRSIVLFGIGTLAIAAAAFTAWGVSAPLGSAVIASGQLTVESHRKPVAHLEGGIVREILIREGDNVQAGQTLLHLDATQADAARDGLAAQRDALLVLDARLTAEQEGSTALILADELTSRLSGNLTIPRIVEIVEGQRTILVSRKASLDGQVAMLEQEAARADAEIASEGAQIRSLDVQRSLIGDEIADVRTLYAKGLERKPRLLALERQLASLDGAASDLEGRIARAGQTIAQTTMHAVQLREQRLSEIAIEQRDIRMRLADIDERLRAATDVSFRHAVIAPASGVVMGLTATPGAVVKPGETILEIVPIADRLLVSARVAPNDVDEVQVGQKAELRLLPFRARWLPPAQGRVRSVSPDSINDPRTGAAYFEASIDLESLPVERSALQAGMPAEVLIVTGERTFWHYLVQPVTDSFRRALRER
jgi:HlyD family secretion protein